MGEVAVVSSTAFRLNESMMVPTLNPMNGMSYLDPQSRLDSAYLAQQNAQLFMANTYESAGRNGIPLINPYLASSNNIPFTYPDATQSIFPAPVYGTPSVGSSMYAPTAMATSSSSYINTAGSAVGGHGVGGDASSTTIGSQNVIHQVPNGAPVFIGPTYGAPSYGGLGIGGDANGGSVIATAHANAYANSYATSNYAGDAWAGSGWGGAGSSITPRSYFRRRRLTDQEETQIEDESQGTVRSLQQQVDVQQNIRVSATPGASISFTNSETTGASENNSAINTGANATSVNNTAMNLQTWYDWLMFQQMQQIWALQLWFQQNLMQSVTQQ